MSESITVATANSYYGELLKSPRGLEPFESLGADVLLMQEVHCFAPEELEKSLSESGFDLVHSNLQAGLGIAIHRDSQFSVDKNSLSTKVIQEMGGLSKLALQYSMPFAQRFRSRALIGVDVKTEDGQAISVYTSHPIVFARPRARNKQVRAIVKHLGPSKDVMSPAVFAADMNHYPGPRSVDRLLESAGFHQLEISEPTWRIRGSKHEWIAGFAGVLTRRSVDSFDAQLDSMWFRGVNAEGHEVLDIQSDHRAIIGRFSIEGA